MSKIFVKFHANGRVAGKQRFVDKPTGSTVVGGCKVGGSGGGGGGRRRGGGSGGGGGSSGSGSGMFM